MVSKPARLRTSPFELGLVEVEDLQSIPRTRFAAIERKKAVALLKSEGKSNRQIAEELEVNKDTVAEDLGKPKRTRKSVTGCRTEDDRLPDTYDDDEFEARTETIKQNFLIRADRAASSAAYEGPLDEEVRRMG
jgi:hypothetical protein